MNAVGYARFSSHNQTEKSIEAQVREISAYASLSGYNLVKVYADRAKSGYSSDRPEFQQMIRDSASGLFEVVIVHKYDRFGRDSTDAAHYERQLRINGVRLVSVEEQVDANTPEGALLKSMIQAINNFYGMNLAREVMKGLKTNALKGLHTGGKPALGYDIAPDLTYVINEVEAEAVRLIFDMYNTGYSYGDIINTLNTGGFKTKRGSAFGKNSLYDILRNEKYTGVLIYNKQASKDITGKRNHRKSKPAADILRVEGVVPQIVEKELFFAVQEKMESNKHTNARHKAKAEYLLSGKLFCGLCGSAMTGERRIAKNKEYGYYVCSSKRRKLDCTMGSVNQKLLEAEVVDQLNKKIFNPKSVDQICGRIYELMKQGGAQDQAALLRKQIASLETSINNGYNAILKGFDQPEFKQKLDELIDEKRTLALQLFELEQVPSIEATVEEIRANFMKHSNLGDLPFIQRRAVIERFVHKIIVYPNPDGGFRVRIVVATENPAKELTDYLDMSGDTSPAPKRTA